MKTPQTPALSTLFFYNTHFAPPGFQEFCTRQLNVMCATVHYERGEGESLPLNVQALEER